MVNFKHLIRRAFHLTVNEVILALESKTGIKGPFTSVPYILRRRASIESAEFAEQHIENAMLFFDSTAILDYAISEIIKQNTHGLILEAGVYKGKTINRIAKYLSSLNDNRMIYGFDSFKGLSENWTGQQIAQAGKKVHKLDYFDQQGILPKVEDNVTLINGFIEETFPKFLDQHADEKIAFLHIDTDTYSPAKTMLQELSHRKLFKVGSLILFDEFYGYPNWKNHEYRALIETFSEEQYEFTAFSNNQALIELKYI